MSEIAELNVSLEVNTEKVAADSKPGHAKLDVTIKGTLRRRALDLEYIPALGTAPVKVCDLSEVEGEPVLVIFQRSGTLTARQGWILFEECEYLGSNLPTLKPRGVWDSGRMAAPSMLGPEAHWFADDWALYGAFIASSPWLAYKSSVWLTGGPWSLLLLEFEPGTVETVIKRS